jgi:hypothetical protein
MRARKARKARKAGKVRNKEKIRIKKFLEPLPAGRQA